MISSETVRSIVTDTQTRFNEQQRKTFIKYLVDEIGDIDDIKDVIDVLNGTPEDFRKLDTIVRDHYIDAYFNMHLNR